MLDNRHSIDLPYWARPGLRFMAAADDSGDPEFVDADEDEDDDDDADDDGDADPDEGKSDEQLRSELKAVRESLNKSAGSNKTKRDRLKKLQEELVEARKPKPAKTEGEAPTVDVEAVKAEARAEALAQSNSRTVKAEARGSLKALGIPADQVGRIVGMLELDDVEIDDEGNVEGVDEAIADLRESFPQLFPSKRRRKSSVAGESDRDGREQRSRQLSTSELQAKAARGR